MRIFAPATVALLLPLVFGPCTAFAACTGKQQNDGICGNRELMALHEEGEAKLKALAAAADPLTALLMRRDQRWVMDMVGQQGDAPYDPQDEVERLRKERVLKRRLADLNRMVPGAVAESVNGHWINALGDAQIEKRGDGLAVEIVSRPDFRAGLPAECRIAGELKLAGNGWYTGAPKTPEGAPQAGTPQANGAKIELRLRLQGNTLRIVISQDDDAWLSACDGRDTFTGTYFLTGPGTGQTVNHAVNLAARTVAPSFECTGTRNSDEEEICSDPDLARLDADIARTYRDTLKRLDAKLAAALRDDERAWAKGNAQVFDIFLHPYWDKQGYFVIQTGYARTEWETRLSERLAMLANIDEKRRGLVGHWVSNNALLEIVPDKDEVGSVKVTGEKWITGEYKSHCDFEGYGHVVGESFKADDVLPKLKLDGATLTIDGDDPDPDRNGFVDRKQPDYCTRLSSAKARLFPVKAAAYPTGEAYDRIR